jgi:hypothetical protein
MRDLCSFISFMVAEAKIDCIMFHLFKIYFFFFLESLNISKVNEINRSGQLISKI